MPSLVTHLQSALDPAVTLPAHTIQTIHEGRPLWVRYDLPRIRASVTPAQIATRESTLWRYRELLPLDDDKSLTTLGEGMTPLLPCPRLAAALGLKNLTIKDESLLPTGSFKSRGMSVAVSMARQLGIKRVAIPTAGNAGGALAAYAARAGIECFVFMPDDTPAVNRAEAALYGAHAFAVNGLITDCGAIVREGAARMGWFDFSTLKEPYRLEGKKTMGLELAEQLDWKLPDAIFYPTGGGTGLIGMWKAFAELKELGWLASPRLPRLFSCQSSGCAPIVNAFDKGLRFAESPANPHTLASGLRVPKAVGDFMILDAIRESNGAAIAAEESRLTEWMHLATRLEGISLCPESAACIGAIQQALAKGLLSPDESVVIFNTGAAQKYLEVIDRPLPRIDHKNIDWSAIELARSR
jgi:threonine synthase